MGIALADTAARLGAEVTLVLGPVSLLPEDNSIKIINVTTAEDMARECTLLFSKCDIAILAAAVADFTPESMEVEKIKRGGDGLYLKLRPTKDIAKSLGEIKRDDQVLAGFALETRDETANAKRKLESKKLDLIVLNSTRDRGAGFGHETNKITIIDKYNNIDNFELKTKKEVAEDILKKIISMLPPHTR